MNRQDLRTELSFLVHANEGTSDQDFLTARLNKAIQFAYRDEVRQAKLEGLSRWFRKIAGLIWPASQLRLTLPPAVSNKNISAIWDVTSSNPGSRLVIRDTPLDGGDAFWYSSDTLQWGNTGPGSAMTLQVEYMADAEILTADGDTPALIPPEYHDLIVWGAALYLRDVADEMAPPRWVERHSMMQRDLYKYMSKGRPFTDVPMVGSSSVSGIGLSEPAITAGPGGGLDP